MTARPLHAVSCWERMARHATVVLVIWIAVLCRAGHAIAAAPATRPLLLAHTMPWFEAPPASPHWGWHWTMNHFDPEREKDGRREVASHFYPLIGPYDSGDPWILECQLLTMKLAGIDGVIVDWYGLTDHRDYAILHRNTTRLLEQAERLNMKFVVCYEDQTIPALVEAGRLPASERAAHAAAEIAWLGKYWFHSPSYVRLDDRPVLLSFGHAGLTDDEWSECLRRAGVAVAYFSQHERRTAAIGGFDWPVPKDALASFQRFHTAMKSWQYAIPVVYPRFVDIYQQAGVGESYGLLEDDGGRSFRRMLELAIEARPPMIQLATWNDWGEGTAIEPSREFGYRDLETIHRAVGAPTPARGDETRSLRLPLRLLQARRDEAADPGKLDAIAIQLATGSVIEAAVALDQIVPAGNLPAGDRSAASSASAGGD